MSETKRYGIDINWIGHDHGVVCEFEDGSGAWVKASDYDALAAKYDSALLRYDTAANDLRHANEHAAALKDSVMAWEARCKELEASLRDAIAIMDEDDSVTDVGLAKFQAVLRSPDADGGSQ